MIDKFQPDLLYSDGPLPFESDGHAAGAQAVAHLYNTSAARSWRSQPGGLHPEDA